MALLFGGTWMVNSVVFCAVLVMILSANLFVLAVRPRSLAPFYIGLVAVARRKRGRCRSMRSSACHARCRSPARVCWRSRRSSSPAWCSRCRSAAPRCRPRVRRKHRRRDVRRAGRVQLDAAGLPVRRPRGDGVLSVRRHCFAVEPPQAGRARSGDARAGLTLVWHLAIRAARPRVDRHWRRAAQPGHHGVDAPARISSTMSLTTLITSSGWSRGTQWPLWEATTCRPRVERLASVSC